ncbi:MULTISPECIES: replication regulatory protein RepA [Enterobacteriaceae]|uniref:replication regulatory protein RepA n=1 Tax=Enterobacteriaceae TaxID=543 RepID=UPI0007506F13|nr:MULTISPECIES: replication regulatory protein RepA [Enterobacteriaceae]ELG0755154.1 replication regulatory protein RepA [Salmonella enterica]ELS5748322.1 replication regulatory protein RepA [Klebsiella aerogenes]KAF1367058.1 cytidylate kinase [Yokenella regensburgei]KUQ07721.1 transcriptional regulator [Klebsiella aerogenes]
MSQTENAATTSSKRAYRKGNPLSGAEKQRLSVERRSATHQSLNALILATFKEQLVRFAEEEGLTQAQMMEKLIEREAERRNRK